MPRRKPKVRRRFTSSTGRTAVIRRTLRVLIALASTRRGLRVDELADEVEESRRTVYRILGALDAVGLTVEHEREGRDVYLRIPRATVRTALSPPPKEP